ncbi:MULTISPECIES: response regulator [unclassified Pseudomonas]|uniref:response regulator n=1 Tax=unclassified Pseudomonas TaxID=196821 RepID=UPI00047F92E4|nr:MULTISPECIES: response regulator [unclassified Pseudomonas]RAS22992.1 response regulator receiver domain-containing protein [Pseudomonas sp. URMO17WK12:I7]SMF55828.1 Response regulator containing CheY-like receiver, AAA-type ATPase, and DNA-binding domains [Pseudomonas sp. URMO17WK12:I5]
MHLLVVEDDDIVRMLMLEVLDELGYSTIEAENATAALKIIEDTSQQLALLVTDVGLPDMRGEELATKARAARPLLPVMFASGYAESVDVPEGMHLIGKPFTIDQLRDKVLEILGTP